MSSREDPSGRDEVALRDLVVGEPAVHRVLDAQAARAKAEQLVREASADPRIADVVGRVGDGAAGEDADADADASVREHDPLASEVQRPTTRLRTASETAPRLDPHARVTEPRLVDAEHPDSDVEARIERAQREAFEAASRSLRASAGQAQGDHRRLAILGAAALAVGILLLALVATRRTGSPTAPAPSSTGDVAIELVAPPSPAQAGAASATTATTATPTSLPSASSTPGSSAPSGPSTPASTDAPAKIPQHVDPTPSAPEPHASATPSTPPTPSSDRPF